MKLLVALSLLCVDAQENREHVPKDGCGMPCRGTQSYPITSEPFNDGWPIVGGCYHIYYSSSPWGQFPSSTLEVPDETLWDGLGNCARITLYSGSVLGKIEEQSRVCRLPRPEAL